MSNHKTHTNHTDHQNDHDDHDHHVDHTGHEGMFRRRFWVSLALTIPVLLYSQTLQEWFGFQMPGFPGSAWIVPVFSVVIFAYGGVPFLEMAVPEFKNRQPGMMALISLAISVAFIYSLAATLFDLGESFYWELVTLIDVMLFGHWMEMRSVRQASSALDELAKLMPDRAERITEEGETETVPVGELRQGDRVLIRPGESVPADGEVIEGTTRINEAMITGESKPVKKEPGEEVIGGTLNAGDGSLRVRVTATGDETALAGIMRLVDEAQQSKSDAQLLADRAAAWLFYIALGAAVVTAVGWVIATGFDIEVVKRVTTVLVIACPHALGLAVPLVVAISTSLGARNGILVRDRLALENARELDVIIFDKTGTLTKGEFGVVGIATEGRSEASALGLAAVVEGDSEHLLAQAIREKAKSQGVDRPEVSSFEAIKGRGVKATHDGNTVYVGGPQLLEMLELAPPDALQDFVEQANHKGQTVVYLIEREAITAAFALADVVREESATVVARLHEMGLEVAMLTGDSEDVARAVAEELNIDRFFAEVLPKDKDSKVQALQREGKKVAMVGDGVNDAPALTRADVGIAIGSGTDVAVESAGLILVKSNPMDVVHILELSRATHQKMVQNLFWAAGYNVAAIPLAAGVLAPWGILFSPAFGALLMSLSTVIVAINAQFLRRLSFS